MSVPSALAQVQSRSGGAHVSVGIIAVRSTVRIAGLVAAGLTIAACVIALVVGLSVAAAARHWLAYPFSGIPARPGVAAMLAATGVGIYPDLTAAGEAMVTLDPCVAPEPAHRATYDHLFARYVALYPRLRDLMG